MKTKVAAGLMNGTVNRLARIQPLDRIGLLAAFTKDGLLIVLARVHGEVSVHERSHYRRLSPFEAPSTETTAVAPAGKAGRFAVLTKAAPGKVYSMPVG